MSRSVPDELSLDAEGYLPHYRPEDIDHLVELPGFASAMAAMNWLSIYTDGLAFPEWNVHHSSSAKTRDYETKRKARYRAKREPDKPSDGKNCPGFVPVSPGQCPEISGTREEKRREESIRGMNSPETPSCSETASPPSEREANPLECVELPILSFPVVGSRSTPEWHLTESLLAELNRGYPGVDVLAEARKARAWTLTNPTKRKTARGMPRFLNSWMDRAQNQASQATAGESTPYRGTNSAVAIAEERRKRRAEIIAQSEKNKGKTVNEN